MRAPTESARFPISFEPWYRVLSTLVGLLPSKSCVIVDGEQVRVLMGWAFRARFPRSAIGSVARLGRKPVSRGVHGFAGRWLVNGSGSGIVTFGLDPRQRGYVMGFPVRLKALMVSVADPAALARAVGRSLEEAP